MGPANVYPARDVPRELPEMGSEMLDVICPVQESDVMHNVGSEIDSPGFALVLLGVGDDLIGLGHCGLHLGDEADLKLPLGQVEGGR